MLPYHQDDWTTIYHGDNRDVLRHLLGDPSNRSDASAPFHAIITDPPYGLGAEPDALAMLRDWLTTGHHDHESTGGFMGKQWDSFVPQPATWKLCHSLLKPGGHILAFGGTRTYDLVALGLRIAGFELRDQIDWIYGSGFPKNLDVSKAIDKAGIWNEEFDEVRAWLREKVKQKGLKHSEIDRAIGNENSHMASHFLGTSQPMLPTWEQWKIIKQLLGVDDDIDRPPKCTGYERAIIGYRKVNSGLAFTSVGPTELPVTAPATDAAKQWDGYGTALKPAHEPICLARKPIDQPTIAQNVQLHHTGALNIDACRIPVDANGADATQLRTMNRSVQGRNGIDQDWGMNKHNADTPQVVRPEGRWPANIIHDGSDEVLACFPSAPGQQGDLTGHSKDRKSKGIYGDMHAARDAVARSDTGSAARFFYCAKASRAERNHGLENIPPTTQGHNRFDKCATCGNYIFQNKDRPSACTCEVPERIHASSRNPHPTIKPIALMRYLIRLICPMIDPANPPVILDPYGGSGTTAIAAKQLGIRCAIIEQDASYCEIAKHRLLATKPRATKPVKSSRRSTAQTAQLSLI